MAVKGLGLLILLVPFVAEAKALSLPEYLRSYLAQDASLKTSKDSLKVARQSFITAKDLYQTQLTVTPDRSEQMIESLGAESSLSSTTLSTSLSQGLASGTTLTYNYAKRLDDTSDSTVATVDNFHSLELTQSLWNNIFGAQDRAKARSSRRSFESAELKFAAEKMAACDRGVALFVDTFRQQREYEIYQEIEKGSAQVLNSTSKSYKKRIVRKIDWLSARADHLRTQSLLKGAERDWKKSRATLKFFGKAPENLNSELGESFISLQSPEKLFTRFKVKKSFDPETNLSVAAARKNEQAKKEEVYVARNNSRSDLDLSFEVGTRDGLNSSLDEFDEQFVTLGLSLGWPVNNQTLNASVRTAKANHNTAQVNLHSARRTAQQTYYNAKKDQQTTAEQLKISRSKVKIYSQQIKEARRLLRGGKIEFEDYIRFRDRYLNERLTEVSLLESLWSAQVDLAQVSNQYRVACLGVGNK